MSKELNNANLNPFKSKVFVIREDILIKAVDSHIIKLGIPDNYQLFNLEEIFYSAVWETPNPLVPLSLAFLKSKSL